MKRIIIYLLLLWTTVLNVEAQVYLLNGVEVTGQFSIGGITYPSNWLSYSSTAEKAAVGIVMLNKVYPTLSAGQKYATTYTDNIGLLTRTYNVVAKTIDDSEQYSHPISPSMITAWSSAASTLGSLATVAFSGNYNDLLNKPATSTQIQPDWNASSGLGSILNKPTIPAAQVQSDWSAISGMGVILNKPLFSTVATTGAYADLTGKPNIPTGTVSSITFSAPFVGGTVVSTGTVSMLPASGSQDGYLTAANFNIFNNKQPAGAYLLANQTINITGAITGTGTTSIVTTLGTANATPATYGSATQIPVFAVDIYGRVISVTNTTITNISGNAATVTTNANLTGEVTSVGNATTIPVGSIGNTKLVNSGLTINGTLVPLGGSGTIAAAAGTLTGTTLASNITSFGAAMALGTPASGNLANCTGYAAANLPTIALTGIVTGSATGGSIATTITPLAVTNAMLAGSIAYGKLSLVGAILNTDLAGSIAYSKLSLAGAILNTDLAGSIAYSKLLLAGSILNTDLAGSIDASTKLTGVLPFASGGMAGSAATSATTGTMTVNMTSSVITITPTGACTFNGSGGLIGQLVTFVVTTSGTSAFVLTFGTNFKSTGTLSTGTVTAKVFAVTFRCYSVGLWTEITRTIAQ